MKLRICNIKSRGLRRLAVVAYAVFLLPLVLLLAALLAMQEQIEWFYDASKSYWK